jgi:exosortase/archaeosortase family protein
MSQDDPPEQESGESARETHRPVGIVGRLRAFWAVPTYRFAVLFIAFLTGISMIYPAMTIYLGPYIRTTENATAEMVYRFLSFFSSEVTLTYGRTVTFGHFPVTVIWECSGYFEALLLGAALLAFPTSWYKIALGFVIGFPLIWAMNIARIAVLLVVGRYSSPSFEFVHVYFWQATMVLMVASTWLVWVLWVVRTPGTAPRAPA